MKDYKRNYIFSKTTDLTISIMSIIIILISLNLQVRTRNTIWISLFFIYGILNIYKYYNYKKNSDLFTGVTFFIFSIIGIMNLTYFIRIQWSTIWFALLFIILCIPLLTKYLNNKSIRSN